jgi:ketosteroid isomerase-like protein
MSPLQTVQRFIAHINARDAQSIAADLSEDHLFIDSLGTRVSGRDSLRAGWRAYLAMVPDYALSVDSIFCDGPDVVVLGRAQGTFTRDGSLKPENAWATPAAFHARVEHDRIARWQVYADNEPLRRCMQRAA